MRIELRCVRRPTKMFFHQFLQLLALVRLLTGSSLLGFLEPAKLDLLRRLFL